jgi:hypothetical protein
MTNGIDPQIILIRGVQTLSLHDLTGVSIRLSEDGLGLPPVRRLVERGPAQNGDTDVGFRLEPRIVNMVLLIAEDDVTGYWASRRALQRMLAPSSVPLRLRIVLPTGETRQLDVAYTGGLTWDSSSRLVTAHQAGFQLRAADPTFYDPSGQSVVFAVPSASGAWTIPWEIPWGIGSSTINATQAVTNPGDWASYPIITVTGPITNLVITNLTTGDTLDFTGHVIAGGTTYTIDTTPGAKTVTDQAGTRQIDKLTDDSDLATFRIAADPDAPGGVNSIRVTGSLSTGATQIFIQYNPRYSAL